MKVSKQTDCEFESKEKQLGAEKKCELSKIVDQVPLEGEYQKYFLYL